MVSPLQTWKNLGRYKVDGVGAGLLAEAEDSQEGEVYLEGADGNSWKTSVPESEEYSGC